MSQHTRATLASQRRDERAQQSDRSPRDRQQRELWAIYAISLLGLWLFSSPLIVSYDDTALQWNDLVCGLLLIALGLLAVNPTRSWARWIVCLIGIWLLLAPLVFWAPGSITFVTENLIGTLAIAFSVLVPGVPNMRLLPGPDIPPGWSYNPSSWAQRAPMIVLAILCFFISRYLAAYQLGYIDQAWDPFLGNSTMHVLNSDLSQAWPVPDAGLGSISYLLEALSGFMGLQHRWRTLPWMVVLFGIQVIPLGFVSIALVISQPVIVGSWCSLCLLTALFMLIMIPLTVDEVAATLQFLVQVRRQGKPFWVNFWRGGTTGQSADGQQQGTALPSLSPGTILDNLAQTVAAVWNLLLTALLGFWLMATPDVFGATGAAATSNYLVGPIVAVIAFAAMAEIVRSIRFLTIFCAIWLLASVWWLPGAVPALVISDLVVAALLIVLALRRGPIHQRYGGWTRFTR